MWLLHGTTRARAEAILAGGPDLHFKEPDGVVEAENISFCVEGHVSVLRPAVEYAIGKASAFPAERGAAILAVDVPDDVVEAAAAEVMGPLLGYLAARTGDREEAGADLPTLLCQCRGVIQFDEGPALNALLEVWSVLPKEIREVP